MAFKIELVRWRAVGLSLDFKINVSSYSIEKDETIEISKNLSIGFLNESFWATTDIETGLKDGESKLQGIGV